MDFLDSSLYTHFPHHDQIHEQLQNPMPNYVDAHAMHNYAMSQQQQHQGPMMPNPPSKGTETKARLGKDEVEILEREFNKNPKPTTQTKRTFAESMDVELARINNWFQNRRAKSKTERKIELEAAKVAAEEQLQEALNYSGQSSPDFFNENRFLQHSATFPMMSGPPPAAAPCNPQYADPSNASMESLDRTLVAAQNGLRQETFSGMMEQHNAMNFGISVHDSAGADRAQFPSPEESGLSPFDTTRNYSYSSLSSVYHPATIPEIQHSPEEVCENTPVPFGMHVPQIMTTFPSQLLPQPFETQSSSQSNEGSQAQSPEDSPESTYGIGFKYEIQESEESSMVPPPPSSLPFRSPPAPMDIASRRKKVHIKPTTLLTEAARGRPGMGPRTVSHAADGFRRSSDSPMASPMRRIVSAGGNRKMSGRIQKSGVESAQRSPMNFGCFPDTGSFIEHNYHNIRNPPTLTASSSLTSSLAPPTPMSPRDRQMTLKREPSLSSSESPAEMNYVYSAGGFTHMDGDRMASPPETPQNGLGVNNIPSNNGWPSQEFHETWYDVPDEPIYTPALDVFPMELQMPPAYLCSVGSQPVTPAFGSFQPNLMFNTNNGSPQFEHEQPLYTHSNQSNTEYTFPDTQSHFSMGMFPSPINQQKTFQFSNSTPADFTEK